MRVWIYAGEVGGEQTLLLENHDGEYDERGLSLTVRDVDPAALGIAVGGRYTVRAVADPRAYGVPAECGQAEPGLCAFGLAGPIVLPGPVDSRPPTPGTEVKYTSTDGDDPARKRVEQEIAEEETRRRAEAEAEAQREREREEAERIIWQEAEARERERQAEEAQAKAAQEQEEREREREADERQRALDEEEENRRRVDEEELDRRETPEEVREEGTIRDNPRRDLIDKRMEPTYEPDGDYDEVDEK